MVEKVVGGSWSTWPSGMEDSTNVDGNCLLWHKAV